MPKYKDQIKKIFDETKVIVRQVGHGQKHFWSVIPAWRKDRYEGLKLAVGLGLAE